jgi:hypothetical protein
MPRIPDFLTDCSIYLYPSEHAARRCLDAGGSGFLVQVTAADPKYAYLYAVTNRHLIDDGFCTLRLNRKSGDSDCIVTPAEGWFLHPDSDDVAIYPLALQDDFKWNCVPVEMFADRECVVVYNLGYGDEVFLVGRLIAHSGRQKNTPVVRFGNISLGADPAEPVRCGNHEYEAFLIECRSISGFSGSPVFVQVNRFYEGEKADEIYAFRRRKHPFLREVAPVTRTPNLGLKLPWSISVGPLLLGIDFGHLPLWSEVFQGNRKTDYRAKSNTGIAGVVPSWKIIDVLNTSKLAEEREKENRKLIIALDKLGPTISDSTGREG